MRGRRMGVSRSMVWGLASVSESGSLGFEEGETDVLADIGFEALGIPSPAGHPRILQNQRLGFFQRQAVLDRLFAGPVDTFEQFPVPLQDVGAGLAMTGQPDGTPRVLFQFVVGLEGAEVETVSMLAIRRSIATSPTQVSLSSTTSTQMSDGVCALP